MKQKKGGFILLPSKQFWIMVLVSAILVSLFDWIQGRPPTNAGAFGGVFGASLAIIIIVCLVSLIPAGLYWLVKRDRMPGLTIFIWIVWAVSCGVQALSVFRVF